MVTYTQLDTVLSGNTIMQRLEKALEFLTNDYGSLLGLGAGFLVFLIVARARAL